MIKAAPTAKATAARSKPRPKKPVIKSDDIVAAAADNEIATSAASGGATDAKQKPKRRRSAPKKKEIDSDAGNAELHKDSRDDRALPLGLAFLQRAHDDDQRYERAPRLLPDIIGVKALTATEVTADIKHIQSALQAFEARIAALLPSSAPPSVPTGPFRNDSATATITPDDLHAPRTFIPRRARPNGVVTPEELVATLPACRRAVRVTQRELAALKRERDDLERAFMHMRSQYVQHVRSLATLSKQHDKVARTLGRTVIDTARGLASSRRRTNALQDIMTELETRGRAIVRLTRDKRQLETLLTSHNIALPEPDAIYVGDRVQCALGVGNVAALDETTRILTVALDSGARAFVHADDDDDIRVLAVETTYVDAERALKQQLFDKIGALVQPRSPSASTTAGAATSSSSARSRSSGVSDLEAVIAAVGGSSRALDSSDGSDGSDDDGSDDDNGSDNDADGRGDADAKQPPPAKKKRKLVAPPLPPGAKKRSKQQPRVIEYPASTIPVTPYDTALLLSPLSALPDRVAAVGSSAVQWNTAYLPTHMREWEQERYDALQMKGELERLRFQLQKAEAEKLDAQQHASDQLESINQLVTQLDKLRESAAHSHNSHSSGNGAAAAATGTSCLHCHGSSSSSSSNGSRKTSAATAAKVAKAAAKKDAAAKQLQTLESADDTVTVGGSDDADAKRKSASLDDDSGDAKSTHDNINNDDDDAAESSDDASSQPTARSLRPRRKPTTSNSTAASPKQSSSK